jgi:hypothetical protein
MPRMPGGGGAADNPIEINGDEEDEVEAIDAEDLTFELMGGNVLNGVGEPSMLEPYEEMTTDSILLG